MVNKLQIFVLGSLLLLTADVGAAELSLGVGATAYQTDYLTGNAEFDSADHDGTDIKATFAIHNVYGEYQHHKVGVGLDYFNVNDQRLIGYRALDYRYQVSRHFQGGLFLGAASLDSGIPQNGYYGGVNLGLLDAVFDTDIVFEINIGSGLARDRTSKDVPGEKPDIFLDFVASSITLQKRF